MSVAIDLLEVFLWVFIAFLLARFVIVLVTQNSPDWRPQGFTVVLVELTLTVTDFPVKRLRSILPPVRIGGVVLDLSLLVLLTATYVAIYLLKLAP